MIPVTHRRPGRITSAIHAAVAIRLTIENSCCGVTTHLSCDRDRLPAGPGRPRDRKPHADGAEYCPDNEHTERDAIRSDERLPAQRLPQQDCKDPDITCGPDEHHADACELVRTAAAQGEREERQDLDRVQADKVRDAQVSVFNAPACSGEAWPAVGSANRVRAGDRDAPRRACLL